MESATEATHFLTPVNTEHVKHLVHQNRGRRFAKAVHAVHTKPRKDFHAKGFKNPAENIIAIGQGAHKKSKMPLMKLIVLGIMGGSTFDF